MEIEQRKQTTQIEQIRQIHFHTLDSVFREFVIQLIVFYIMSMEFATNIAENLMKIDDFQVELSPLALPLLAVSAE